MTNGTRDRSYFYKITEQLFVNIKRWKVREFFNKALSINLQFNRYEFMQN